MVAIGYLSLRDDEDAWVNGLAGTPGLAATAHVARWWRETKIQMMARLTVTALQRIDATMVMDRYLDDAPVQTLFFLPEVLGFLRYVGESADVGPVVGAVAQFERALLQAREHAASAEVEKGQLPLSGGVSFCEIIRFPAPPEVVLGALLSAGDLPGAAAKPTFVEVSSALPQFWRVTES